MITLVKFLLIYALLALVSGAVVYVLGDVSRKLRDELWLNKWERALVDLDFDTDPAFLATVFGVLWFIMMPIAAIRYLSFMMTPLKDATESYVTGVVNSLTDKYVTWRKRGL